MKAVVFKNTLSVDHHYYDPQPGSGEALIKVRWAGICATDLEIVKGYMGFRGVLGHEFVGEVVSGSKSWMGKRVVGEINVVCGQCDLCRRGLSNHCRNRSVLGILGRDGAFADYLVLPERNLHEVPATLSDEEAVFVEPLAAAYQVLKQCSIDQRTQVAVLGSGRLGLLVAQVLQRAGCRLTVIGRNPQTLSFCDKRAIQTRLLQEVVPRSDCDVVVDCTGNPAGLSLALQLVRPRGTIILKSTYADKPSVDLAPVVVQEVLLLGSRCGPFAEAIAALARKEIEVATLISRRLDLDKAVQAFEAAADPQNIKILLRVNST